MKFATEPALWLGLLSALLAVGIGFGLNLSTEQVGLIMAAASALVAVITRSVVSPTAGD